MKITKSQLKSIIKEVIDESKLTSKKITTAKVASKRKLIKEQVSSADQYFLQETLEEINDDLESGSTGYETVYSSIQPIEKSEVSYPNKVDADGGAIASTCLTSGLAIGSGKYPSALEEYYSFIENEAYKATDDDDEAYEIMNDEANDVWFKTIIAYTARDNSYELTCMYTDDYNNLIKGTKPFVKKSIAEGDEADIFKDFYYEAQKYYGIK